MYRNFEQEKNTNKEKEVDSKKPYTSRSSRILDLCEPSTSNSDEIWPQETFHQGPSVSVPSDQSKL